MIKKLERIYLRDLLIIMVGTFIMAVAINFAFDPIGLDTGGVTGLAIVIKYACRRFFDLEIPVWVTNFVLNVPLFLIAIRKKGIRFIAKTGFATAMLTLWLAVLPVTLILDDMLLSALFGGVLSGAGIGLVFSTVATTGGTDLFAALIHERHRHLSIPQLLLFTDGLIVVLGIVMFGLESVLYSIIVVFVVSKVSDGILDGIKFAKMAYIISDRADDIAKEILSDMDRGATGIGVKGMYSGEDKHMLFCVVGKKEVVELIDIVSRHDGKAFMVIADAREVMGEGFADVRKED